MFVVLGAAAVVVGCSAEPTSIAVVTQDGGLPPEAIIAVQAASSNEPAYRTPTAGWLEDGSQIAVALVSPVSCSVVPTSLDVVDSHRLSLEVFAAGGSDCGTGDKRRITHILETPRGIDFSEGVTLEYMGASVVLPPVFNPSAAATNADRG